MSNNRRIGRIKASETIRERHEALMERLDKAENLSVLAQATLDKIKEQARAEGRDAGLEEAAHLARKRGLRWERVWKQARDNRKVTNKDFLEAAAIVCEELEHDIRALRGGKEKP